MFIRPSLIKTQIKRNKNAKKVLMRSVTSLDIADLADKTYFEVYNGKSIDKIFQENSIAKKHKEEYKTLLLNKFLRQFNGIVSIDDRTQWKSLEVFSNFNVINTGFIYCLSIDKRIKIGKTKNLTKRIASYKSHNGVTPNLLAVKMMIDYDEAEKMLIRKLHGLGITDEWFEDEHAKAIIELFEDI